MITYHFTHAQLCKLLDQAIGMYQEFKSRQYNTQKAMDECKASAVNEMIEGLDAEKDASYVTPGTESQIMLPEKSLAVIHSYLEMRGVK